MPVLLSPACGWCGDMVTVLVIMPVMLRGRRGGDTMLLFLWSAAWAWAGVLTWVSAYSDHPSELEALPGVIMGPVAWLLIKTPPIHSSWWIFSIIWSHWCPSGPVPMSRARVPMMLWPPVAMAGAPVCSGPAPAWHLTGARAPWPGLCAPSPRHRPSCRAQGSHPRCTGAGLGSILGTHRSSVEVLAGPGKFDRHPSHNTKWKNFGKNESIWFLVTSVRQGQTIPTNYLLCQYLWTSANQRLHQRRI